MNLLRNSVPLRNLTKAASYFDALFLPGGHGTVVDFTNEVVTTLVTDFEKANRVIGAVCHGPVALVNV